MNIFFIILVFILSSLFKEPTAVKYYISAAGSDANNGTSTSTPWATISKVTSSAGSFAAGDSVLFRRGDTFVGTLPATPNGSSGNPITYGAYGSGADPIISGLSSLTSWTNLGSNIWSASCNSGNKLDLVLVGGVATPMGRTPNAGSYYNVDSHTNLSGGSATLTSTSIPAGTHNWTNAELVVASVEYNRNRNRITSHSSNTITYTQESIANVSNGNKYFIQWDLYACDQQNEWFYNPSTHVLYMYSTVNPSTLSGGVQAATLDYGFNDDPLNDISFDHLEFFGFDSIGVRCRTATRVRVTNCTFDRIGTDGLVFDVGVNCTLNSNTFMDINNTAMRVIYSKQIVMRYNDINRMGLKEGMALGNNQQMDGILFENSADQGMGTYIEYNNIQNVGYCGITFSGKSVQMNHNYINNYGLMLSDGGGIYTCCNTDVDGAYRVIEYNIIENGPGNRAMMSGGGTGGMPPIYIDDNGEFVNIRYNSLYRGTRYGIFLHNANNIIIQGNKIDSIVGEASIGFIHDDLGSALTNLNVTGNTIYGLPGQKMYDFHSLTNDFGSMGIINGNTMSRTTTTTPFTFFAENGSVNASYSLATMQSTYGIETAGTLITVNADSMRWVSNHTNAYVFSLLGGTYNNLSGTVFPSWIALPPYQAEIIRKITNVTSAAVNFSITDKIQVKVN